MIRRITADCGRSLAAVGEDAGTDAKGGAPRDDFNRLPLDEIERLIALCEAPALLWRKEPAPVRAPEPFGMIA